MNAASLVQRVAGISGALAVAAGAYGAHGFRHSEASDYQRELYDTANKYHIYHSLALLGAARCRKPALAGQSSSLAWAASVVPLTTRP